MLQQHILRQKLAAHCKADPAVVAAMLYGSLATEEADAFSDMDVVLFVQDDAFNALDEQRAWLQAGLDTVHLYFVNEFGVATAVFPGLIRGEFHFDKASRMAEVVAGWRADVMWFPSLAATLLVDKTGELGRLLSPFVKVPIAHGQAREEQQFIVNSAVNWLVFGLNVLQRGEVIRALELLSMLHRPLLMLARVVENSTIHWATASRAAEDDLSAETVARFATCTATADATVLWQAYRNAWDWLNDMVVQLDTVAIPSALKQALHTNFSQQ